MKTLADLTEAEGVAFVDAASAALSALELQRQADAVGQRRPSLAELFAYADDPASVDADAIRSAIMKGGRTARDWRQVREALGAAILTLAAAAATTEESISALNVGRGLRLDVNQSEIDPSIFTLILDCKKSKQGVTPRFLAVESVDGAQYLQIELPPPYRNFIQMDIKREIALRLIAARKRPDEFIISVW